MTLSFTTLSIIGLIETFSINETQHNVMLHMVMLIVVC
jgi:hypothetical protein